MAIEMICVEKGRKGEAWCLDLEGDSVVLRDGEGNVAADIPHNIAPEHLQLPSFTQSIKRFGVRCGKRLIRFDLPKESLEEVKAYLVVQLAAAGPEAMAAKRTKAIRTICLGAFLGVAGVAVSWYGYRAAARNPEGGEYMILHGVVLLGLVLLTKGVADLKRVGKAKKML